MRKEEEGRDVPDLRVILGSLSLIFSLSSFWMARHHTEQFCQMIWRSRISQRPQAQLLWYSFNRIEQVFWFCFWFFFQIFKIDNTIIWFKNFSLKRYSGKFPGSPVVRTLCTSTAGDTGLIPVQGTKIPHATRHGKKRNKKVYNAKPFSHLLNSHVPIVLPQKLFFTSFVAFWYYIY